MYKATREFIKERQKYAEFNLSTASVKRVGGGKPNDCFGNALAVVEKGKSEGKAYVALSGWLVQPYDKVNKWTGIIQHWWNGDDEGNQFDTTPFSDQKDEYVLDFSLYEFSRLNFDRIQSSLAMDILYHNGDFIKVVDLDKMDFRKIKELRTEILFKFIDM